MQHENGNNVFVTLLLLLLEWQTNIYLQMYVCVCYLFVANACNTIFFNRSVRHRNCHRKLKHKYTPTELREWERKFCGENWQCVGDSIHIGMPNEWVYAYLCRLYVPSICSEFGVCANVNKTFLRLIWWCCKAIEHNIQSIRTPNGNLYTNVYFCCSVNSYR